MPPDQKPRMQNKHGIDLVPVRLSAGLRQCYDDPAVAAPEITCPLPCADLGKRDHGADARALRGNERRANKRRQEVCVYDKYDRQYENGIDEY